MREEARRGDFLVVERRVGRGSKNLLPSENDNTGVS